MSNTQTHFSLMGELLDDELPENEQIEELSNHASRELTLVTKLIAPGIFQRAAHDLTHAHLLNDMCTGFLSAMQRLDLHIANVSGEIWDNNKEWLRSAIVPDFTTKNA